LLKNLFNLQPAPKITSVSQPPGKSAVTGITTIVQFTTVKLDNKGNVIARPTDKTRIIKEFLGNGVSLTMVKIPAGSFMMGSPLSEKELNEPQSDEKPQHKVNIKNYFYIGQTEVTQAQYQEIMNINPSEFKGSELPVEKVSWHDAKEFCTKLSQQTSGIYSLPSESQWE
jgi:formylglycine-generating enzyme required for sulfatase activity